jgi:hypothetical protein
MGPRCRHWYRWVGLSRRRKSRWAENGVLGPARLSFIFFPFLFSIYFLQFKFESQSVINLSSSFNAPAKNSSIIIFKYFIIIYFFLLFSYCYIPSNNYSQNMTCTHILSSLRKYNFYCRLGIGKYFNMILL